MSEKKKVVPGITVPGMPVGREVNFLISPAYDKAGINYWNYLLPLAFMSPTSRHHQSG